MKVEQAALIRMINFEKDWNPHGSNTSYRYKDTMAEIEAAARARIKLVKD